ncbi:MAG TPA: DUF488 family protein [Gemmatimonadales bacterium]|nr:DUF488 family protein [Gemmatimonadales bacterium]
MALRIKRAYEPATARDGTRVLVDRIWPRGVTKEAARLARWEKDLAPSSALRRWFGHDPAKWAEFKRRYRKELVPHAALLDALAHEARRGTVTLVFAARDEVHCNAAALKLFLESRS